MIPYEMFRETHFFNVLNSHVLFNSLRSFNFKYGNMCRRTNLVPLSIQLLHDSIIINT